MLKQKNVEEWYAINPDIDKKLISTMPLGIFTLMV